MGTLDIAKYQEMNEAFGQAMYRLWGPTLLCYPADTDSSRSLMATSQQKQILTLANPDVPRILTGFENVFGKYNKAYKKLEGTWQVVDRIDKFGNGMVYVLVLYNTKTHTYDMIEKKIAESRTEKFGFLYNTEVMDRLQPGDAVEDSILYRSTSYDEHMNYRLGKNANVMYSTSNPTIEDAIYIRRGWGDTCQFYELDDIRAGVNDNDIFTNRYGTDSVYKPFPGIGETVKDSIICSTRRVIKEHVLFDFQSKNLRQSYSTDSDYFTSKNAIVYDIDVFYNGDGEFPDNLFYHELNIIYHQCCAYADKVTEWAKRIKEMAKADSKIHYTPNIPYFISKFRHVSNPEYKWKYKDREFSNILVNFKTYALVSLEAGFKLVGRYGDKGVISKIANDAVAEDTGETAFIETMIANLMGEDTELTEEEMQALSKSFKVVEDSEMPYMEDGTKIDILLNASGAIRRLNDGQLDEVDICCIMEAIRKEIIATEDIDVKYDLLFRFLKIVNEDQYKFFYGKYASWSKRVTVDTHTIEFFDGESKRAFIADVEKNGIYLVKPPHARIRYDTVKQLYEAFPFVKPVQLYIDKFGIARKKVMRPAIIGTKYMYALKQTSNKNFSARSMGRVNKKGLPEKSTDKKDNRSEISHNPLKLGEVHNLMSSVSGREMAEHNIFTRSSPIGRKSLIRILKATGDPAAIHKIKVKDSYRNVNADILNAYFLSWGIRLNFLTDIDEIEDAYIDVEQLFRVHGYMVLDRPSRRAEYMRCFTKYEEIIESTIIISEDINKFVWDEVFALPEFADIPKDMQQVCRVATLGGYSKTPKMADEIEDD